MRGIVPKRTEPKPEISTPVEPHNRPYSMPQGGDRAWKAARAGQEDGHRKDFEKAAAELRVMTPSAAVALLENMGLGMLELYLLAEEAGENREFILRSFPKPGVRARERYGPFMHETPATVDA